jgi:hypothetical protein
MRTLLAGEGWEADDFIFRVSAGTLPLAKLQKSQEALQELVTATLQGPVPHGEVAAPYPTA